jgi:DNA-3-methyladenine glycosylase I
MTTYCQYVREHPEDEINRKYHDLEYGFPLESDNRLFERLVLEINQAGLSWITILKKKDHFSEAYDHFDINVVANYGDETISCLLNDAGIIRNRLKINAAIGNARQILLLSQQYGSFKGWLDVNRKLSLEEWVKLFKENFKFTGGEIVKEFLLSTGYLAGAHDPDCPVYALILEKKPAWLE